MLTATVWVTYVFTSKQEWPLIPLPKATQFILMTNLKTFNLHVDMQKKYPNEHLIRYKCQICFIHASVAVHEKMLTLWDLPKIPLNESKPKTNHSYLDPSLKISLNFIKIWWKLENIFSLRWFRFCWTCLKYFWLLVLSNRAVMVLVRDKSQSLWLIATYMTSEWKKYGILER